MSKTFRNVAFVVQNKGQRKAEKRHKHEVMRTRMAAACDAAGYRVDSRLRK